MVGSFKRTGKIGDTRPKSKKHAQRVAVAAAYSKARGRKKTKRQVKPDG